MISTPILSQLNHEKDPRYHESFVRAVETLNRGLAEKEIWNVELNDAKFTLSNAVDRALGIIWNRWLDARDHEYEDWQDDFSSYCSFNQAAGRIRRLSKNAPKSKVMQDYIFALGEVVEIWHAIQCLKPHIKKGRRPNQNKTEEQVALELKNTGVCAICNCRQKLDADKIVHHGYQMSEYNHAGVRLGRCFGTDYLCYELNNAANIAYAPVLANHRTNIESGLRTLKSGTVLTFEIEESDWNHKTHKADKKKVHVYKTGLTADKFARELASRIDHLEYELRTVNTDIKTNDAKIRNWILQPLKYGR